ncbi:MAG: aminoacyl-histidine dipeptidase [Bacteroidia bacterium]|nr:aminoacyl-histidine dipeptidase [Bacteroidia bacterium]
MSTTITSLEPRSLWQHFQSLNDIPRPSKKEERVIQFMIDFGNALGLEVISDKIGNVVIKKPATLGMEDRKTVVLQSHLDMVHQKNSNTQFDFQQQGIQMFIDGDWVKAKGTTLGADNGIGVAATMAILASNEIPHPAIEALFTIDEETGMTGAKDLDPNMLKGQLMLNLDTEDDDELTVGCAGGIDITAQGRYATIVPASQGLPFRITIKGLSGGHSGMDIHLGRGNANKLMNRLLYNLDKEFEIQIADIDGGGLRNAIPRESFATIVVDAVDKHAFNALIDHMTSIYQKEYKTTDPDLTIEVQATSMPDEVVDPIFQGQLLKAMYALPNGIYRMSPDIEGLVQTSNNIARIIVNDGQFLVQCLTRSSVDTEKQDLADAIASALQLIGAKVTTSGAYPGWTPDPNSQIVSLMKSLYEDLFKESPHVKACHAGLECGILGKHFPKMEMISFGPNIRGAHSPDEKAQITSVQKFWTFLKSTLAHIPKQ